MDNIKVANELVRIAKGLTAVGAENTEMETLRKDFDTAGKALIDAIVSGGKKKAEAKGHLMHLVKKM
jgi:hypothetical protein